MQGRVNARLFKNIFQQSPYRVLAVKIIFTAFAFILQVAVVIKLWVFIKEVLQQPVIIFDAV